MTYSKKSILNLLETPKTKIIPSQDSALYIRRGETVIHPIFGRVRVDGIYEADYGHEAFCVLLDFNDTHRAFNLLDLARLKFKQGSFEVVS